MTQVIQIHVYIQTVETAHTKYIYMCVLRQVSLLSKVSPLLPNLTGGRSHFPQKMFSLVRALGTLALDLQKVFTP